MRFLNTKRARGCLALAGLLAAGAPCAFPQDREQKLELNQSPDLPVGHGHFPTVTKERTELFLKTLYGGLKYQPPPVIDPPADPDMKYVWQGNKPKVFTQLDDVNVKFYKKGERGKPAYEVSLHMGDTKFLIKHSLTLRQSQAGGIELPVLGVFSLNKTRKFEIEGQDRTGMIFMVPPFIDNSETRGLLMCPRDIPENVEKGDKLAFVDTGYEIGGVEFGQVAAQGEAKVLTGVNPGYAKVSIFTSTNLPRAINYTDSTYAKDPVVSINYTPFVEEQLEEVKNPDDITGGIRVQVDQQLPSGFKKSSVGWSALWIKAVTFDEAFRLSQPIKRFYDTPFEKLLPAYAVHQDRSGEAGHVGVEVAVGPGRCFLVLRETNPPISVYTKEPLKIPDRLLENVQDQAK